MSDYFYKFKDTLNEKLLKYLKLEEKVNDVRDNFLENKGLLEHGMSYYKFVFEPMLTYEQVRKLDIPKSELKKNGEPRKDSKTMKAFNKEYQDELVKNNLNLRKNPKEEIRWTIHNLFEMNGTSFRFSYAYFSRKETVYLKSNAPLKEHKNVIAIRGSELYQAFENEEEAND